MCRINGFRVELGRFQHSLEVIYKSEHQHALDMPVGDLLQCCTHIIPYNPSAINK